MKSLRVNKFEKAEYIQTALKNEKRLEVKGQK